MEPCWICLQRREVSSLASLPAVTVPLFRLYLSRSLTAQGLRSRSICKIWGPNSWFTDVHWRYLEMFDQQSMNKIHESSVATSSKVKKRSPCQATKKVITFAGISSQFSSWSSTRHTRGRVREVGRKEVVLPAMAGSARCEIRHPGSQPLVVTLCIRKNTNKIT